jgi:hypothetical protein
VDLELHISGMICNAALPSGPGAVSPERLVRITYRQALTFLARIEAARPPGRPDADESTGMVGLEGPAGGIRFRCWSSTDHVEIELWHASGRCWMANAPLAIAQQALLACPHLDQVFELLNKDACDFTEVNGT